MWSSHTQENLLGHEMTMRWFAVKQQIKSCVWWQYSTFLLLALDFVNPHLGLFCTHWRSPRNPNPFFAKLKRGLGSFMLLGLASWLGNKTLPWLRQLVCIKGTISAELPPLFCHSRPPGKWHCKWTGAANAADRGVYPPFALSLWWAVKPCEAPCGRMGCKPRGVLRSETCIRQLLYDGPRKETDRLIQLSRWTRSPDWQRDPYSGS